MGRKGKGISQVNPIIGKQINKDHNLSRNLVCYYPLNEGGGQLAFNMVDNKPGTLGITSASITANFTRTARGSATTSVACGTPSNLQFTSTTAFTISFWLYMTNTNATCTLAYTSSTNTGPWYMEFNAVGAGLLQFDIYDGTNYHRVSSNTAMTAGKWYHVVVTRNRLNSATTSSTMYINGVDVSARSNSGNPGTLTYTTAQFNIGARGAGASVGGNLANAGFIQNVMIWQNRNLTQTEIKQLYTNPYCILK
jgi:hypothetical protein